MDFVEKSLYVQLTTVLLHYGVLIYGCANTTELNHPKGSQNHIIRPIFGLNNFYIVCQIKEKYTLLTPMELYVYKLLNLMSKRLRPSFDWGFG